MSMFGLRNLAAISAALVLSASSIMLTGCGLGAVSGSASSAASPSTLPGAHIHGKVHGGVYPIQGANIELWQSTTGSWSTSTSSYIPSFYGTTTNTGFIASTTSASQGDGSGMAPGYFNFTQSLTCTPGSYLYLTTTGGGTIASKVNSSVVQVAVIGQCPASASQAAYFNDVNVFLSETSTVAAAYALGNFMSIDTDPTTNLQRVNISATSANTATGACTVTSGTPSCNAAGLAHGFANATNLVDFVTFDGSNPSGAARSSLPSNSSASVPQAMINTIGNILQSCVDSGPSTTSSPSSTCSTLLGDMPTNAAGTAATNTLQATINLARYPNNSGASKFSATLFALQTSNSPFTPMMTSAPTAYSLSIFYPAAAIGDATFTAPVDVALDAADNVYVAYMQGANNGAVAELSSAGTPVFAGAKPTNNASLTAPGTIAVDPSGYVWVTDSSATSSTSSAGNAFGFNTSLTSAKGVGSYFNMYTMPSGRASGIAFDMSGNAFLTRASTDKNVNDYLFASGSYTYTQKGTLTGANLLRAQVDIYGTFKAVGNKTFLSLTPPHTGCNQTSYIESSVTLDTTGGFAMAVDNRANNYDTFLPLSKELATGNVTIAQNSATCYTATKTVNDYAGSAKNDAIPDAAALDGSGNLFWAGTQGRLYTYLGAEGYETSTGATLGGTPTYFFPCYLGGAQTCSYVTGLNGLAADSSGALWYGATDSSGASYLVQHLGMAQPTWPLLAYAQSGVTF